MQDVTLELRQVVSYPSERVEIYRLCGCDASQVSQSVVPRTTQFGCEVREK